jgi:hypothetical protein
MTSNEAKLIDQSIRTGLFVYAYFNAAHERDETITDDNTFMVRLRAMLFAYNRRSPEEHAAAVAALLRGNNALAQSTQNTTKRTSTSTTRVRFLISRFIILLITTDV